jgi:hydroxymethylglutaryl-CoA lyase
MLSYFTQKKANDLNAMCFESSYNEATKIFTQYH